MFNQFKSTNKEINDANKDFQALKTDVQFIKTAMLYSEKKKNTHFNNL